MNRSLRVATFIAGALILAGCQTTSIQSAWYDSSYSGGPLKKIVVVASDGSTSDSRVFEDVVVQKLNAAGVVGVPGYSTVPPDARKSEGPFAEAVARTGADGVLIVRLLRMDTKTQVSTVMMPGPMMGPYGGFYGGVYGGGFAGAGFYPSVNVSQYDVASVQVNLYAVATRRLLWAATTETVSPSTVAKEAAKYADVLIEQFRARGLIPPGKQ